VPAGFYSNDLIFTNNSLNLNEKPMAAKCAYFQRFSGQHFLSIAGPRAVRTVRATDELTASLYVEEARHD